MHRILPNFVYALILTRSRPDIFRKFVTELWPLINVRISFRSISLKQLDMISSNFVYLLILTRSRLGLLPVIFRKFVIELLPLIDVRILFPLNIFRTNRQNFINFCIYIDFGKI